MTRFVPLRMLCRPKSWPEFNEMHSALTTCKKIEHLVGKLPEHALASFRVILRVVPSLKQWVHRRTEFELHPREVEHPERLHARVSADGGLCKGETRLLTQDS